MSYPDELIIERIKAAGFELSSEFLSEAIAITKERIASKKCTFDEAITFLVKWLNLAN